MTNNAEVKEADGLFYLRRDEIDFDVTDEEWLYIISKAARAVMEAIANVKGDAKGEAGHSASLDALRSTENPD